MKNKAPCGSILEENQFSNILFNWISIDWLIDWSFCWNYKAMEALASSHSDKKCWLQFSIILCSNKISFILKLNIVWKTPSVIESVTFYSFTFYYCQHHWCRTNLNAPLNGTISPVYILLTKTDLGNLETGGLFYLKPPLTTVVVTNLRDNRCDSTSPFWRHFDAMCNKRCLRNIFSSKWLRKTWWAHFYQWIQFNVTELPPIQFN